MSKLLPDPSATVPVFRGAFENERVRRRRGWCARSATALPRSASSSCRSRPTCRARPTASGAGCCPAPFRMSITSIPLRSTRSKSPALTSPAKSMSSVSRPVPPSSRSRPPAEAVSADGDDDTVVAGPREDGVDARARADHVARRSPGGCRCPARRSGRRPRSLPKRRSRRPCPSASAPSSAFSKRLEAKSSTSIVEGSPSRS
jgi:hypothetical protein